MSNKSFLTLENNSSFTSSIDLFDIEIDPRSRNYWLSSNGPWKLITILSVYLLFVIIIGPQLMKNRSPFGLRKTMLSYNFSLVVINAYFFVYAFCHSNFGLKLLETKFPPANDFSKETMAGIDHFYFYWLTKFFDLFDTVFFVLRKKSSQITFLHLYHHMMVPILGYIGFIVRPTVPAIYLFMSINSFVHVLMYGYYALAASPSFRHYRWLKKVKKSITQMQLGQFAIYIVYGLIMAKVQTGYPNSVFWFTFLQTPLFYYMFYNFYQNAYKKTLKSN